MKEMWNERFKEDYVYGEAPNNYFKQEIDKLLPGSILLPAEGQGRNALYAASKGWTVSAFDISEVARDKCLALARKFNLDLGYEVIGYDDFLYPEESFDAIALIYSHLPRREMRRVHKKYLKLLKPGGLMIVELFSKEQLNYKSGGPPVADMLVSVDEVKEDFGALDIKQLEQIEVDLSEGRYHQGKASVVRLVAKKRE